MALINFNKIVRPLITLGWNHSTPQRVRVVSLGPVVRLAARSGVNEEGGNHGDGDTFEMPSNAHLTIHRRVVVGLRRSSRGDHFHERFRSIALLIMRIVFGEISGGSTTCTYNRLAEPGPFQKGGDDDETANKTQRRKNLPGG